MNTMSSPIFTPQETRNLPNTAMAEPVSASVKDSSDSKSKEFSEEPFGPVLSRQQDRYAESAENEEIDSEEHNPLNKKDILTSEVSENETDLVAQPSNTAPVTNVVKEIESTSALSELLTSKKDSAEAESNIRDIPESTEQAIASESMPEHSADDINLNAMNTNNRMPADSEVNRQDIKAATTHNAKPTHLQTPQSPDQQAIQRLNNVLAQSESPTDQSEETLHSAQQGVPDGGSFSSDSENSQRRGKTVPPTGNTLPSGLAFLANSSENGEQPGRNIDLQINAAAETSQLMRVASSNTSPQLLTESSTGLASTGLDPAAVTQRASEPLNTENSKSFLIKAPVNSPEWSSQVGDRVRWLAKTNISSAELRLNPAELGSIEVKITIENDQTKVSFLTATGAAKEVIEASLPKLRDLLEHSGLQLEQSDVSQKNQSRPDSEEEFIEQNSHENDLESIVESAISSAPMKGQNQIDHYI